MESTFWKRIENCSFPFFPFSLVTEEILLISPLLPFIYSPPPPLCSIDSFEERFCMFAQDVSHCSKSGGYRKWMSIYDCMTLHHWKAHTHDPRPFPQQDSCTKSYTMEREKLQWRVCLFLFHRMLSDRSRRAAGQVDRDPTTGTTAGAAPGTRIHAQDSSS